MDTDNNTTPYVTDATWEVQRTTEVQIKDQSLSWRDHRGFTEKMTLEIVQDQCRVFLRNDEMSNNVRV